MNKNLNTKMKRNPTWTEPQIVYSTFIEIIYSNHYGKRKGKKLMKERKRNDNKKNERERESGQND